MPMFVTKSFRNFPDDLKDIILVNEAKSILQRLVSLDRRISRILLARGVPPEKGDRIKRDPADWKGKSCRGKMLSECSVPYLVVLKSSLLSFAKMMRDQGQHRKSALAIKRAELAEEWIEFKSLRNER